MLFLKGSPKNATPIELLLMSSSVPVRSRTQLGTGGQLSKGH